MNLPAVQSNSEIDPKTLLVLSLIFIVVFAVSKISFKQRAFSSHIHQFLHTGIIYIVLGFLIGPILGVVTAESVSNLTPLVLFALGWVGFLFGTHIEWESLKKFNLSGYFFTFAQAIFTIVIVFLATFIFYRVFLRDITNFQEITNSSVLLGIVAANTAPAAVFLTARLIRTSSTISLLQFVSALDDIPGVVVLGGLYAVSQNFHVDAGFYEQFLLFLLSTALGCILGFMLRGFLTFTKDEKVEATLLLSVLFFASGLTGFLQLSTLYTTMIMGIVFVHTSDRKEDIYKIIMEREHSIYALLMVLAGAMVRPFQVHYPLLFCLLPLYLATRFFTKYYSCQALAALMHKNLQANPRIGLGLMAQGGMAIPVAISFHRSFKDVFETTDTLFLLVIFAVVLNEFISYYSNKKLVTLLETNIE